MGRISGRLQVENHVRIVRAGLLHFTLIGLFSTWSCVSRDSAPPPPASQAAVSAEGQEGGQPVEPVGMTPSEASTPSGAQYVTTWMGPNSVSFEGKIPVGAGLPAQEGRQGGPYAGKEDTSESTEATPPSNNLPTFQEVVSSTAQSLANLPATPPPVARLHVALTDLAIDSVDSLLVTFNRVDVKFVPDGSIEEQTITISSEERTEDFILLSKGILKPVGSVEFDRNGTVRQVRLIVKSASARLKCETSYRPVKIPSGENTGIKLVGNFPLKIGQQVELVVDFDVERSIRIHDDEIRMKPAIKVFSLDQAHELGLPEGNHKVLITAPSDEPDPFAAGNPDGRGKRLTQDVKFTTRVRKTGDLFEDSDDERPFFTWTVAFSSFKQALLVREFSNTQDLSGMITKSGPDPLVLPATVQFDGRKDSSTGPLLSDGLYIYAINAAAFVSESPDPTGCPAAENDNDDDGDDEKKGKKGGPGRIKREDDDDIEVIDRDKFYGSSRIDNTLPAVAFTKPGSRFIFSHDRVEAELFAKDPLAGEDSNSGLNPATFKASISNGEFPATNPKDIADLLAPSLSGYAPEPFASRGPDLLVEFTRSGLLTETGPCRATMADGTRSAMDGCGGCNCVREGVNILRATVEDNAENERKATGLKFLVDRVKPEGGWETPPFALVPANGDPLITNAATATFQVRFTDPMPNGLNTASGLREDTARILFQNKTGYALERRIGDGQIPALESNPVEFTNPFGEAIAGDLVPLSARLKIAGLSLPDGNYTATAFMADRATASGDAYSAGHPPVNVGEAKVEFCLDRVLPGLIGFDLISPVASFSTDPSFIPSAVPNVTIQCGDPTPSCGLKSLTLVAVRTHAPAPFPSGGPIDIPDETNGINLNPVLCDNQPHTFPQPLGEGKWDFRLVATDKAGNKSALSRNGVFLDETTPFTSDIMVLSATQSVPLPDASLSLPTNRKLLRVGVKYANGLSGVNPTSVGFSYSGPVCGASVPVFAADSHEALSETFAPCEGANTVSVLFRDNAGNQGSDLRTFVADFSPPIVKITSAKRENGSLVVAGTVSDASGIAYVQIEGINISPAPDGSFTSLPIPLGEKERVTLNFADVAGNLGATELSVPATADLLEISYDELGRAVSINWSTPDGQHFQTGTYKYHPDLPGQLTKATIEVVGKGHVETLYDHDGNCDLSSNSPTDDLPSDAIGCFVTTYRDLNGTVEQYRRQFDSRLNQDGTSEVITSDSTGSSSRVVFNPSDNTIVGENALHHSAVVQFENLGVGEIGGSLAKRISETIDSNGVATDFRYNADGALVEQIMRRVGPNGEDRRTEYVYQGGGDTLELVGAISGGLSSLNVVEGDTKYGASIAGDIPVVSTKQDLDSGGNVTREVKTFEDSESKTDFDEEGRVIMESVIRADGESSTTTYFYDNMGRTGTVNADGTILEYEYDGQSERVKSIRENGAVAASFRYDSAERMTIFSDGFTSQKWMDFEPGSQRPRKIQYEVAGQVVKSQTMQYDLKGRLVSEVGSDGQTYSYSYDAGDRLTRASAPGGATTDAAYDVLSRPTVVRSTAGNNAETVSYSYDGQNTMGTTAENGVGRLTGVRVVGSDYARAISWSKAGYEKVVEHDIEGRRFHLDYTRDMEGDITRIAYPGGDAVVYSDVDNKVTFGNQTVLNQAVMSGGRVIQATYANGLTLNTYKDIKGNLNSLVLSDAAGNPLRAYTVERSGKEIVKETTESGTTSYSYDSQGRLTRADRPDGAFAAYQYDSLGNRLSLAKTSPGSGSQNTYYRYGWRPSESQTASSANRLRDIETSQGIARLDYDSAGRLTYINNPPPVAPDSREFKYNARGLLAQLSDIASDFHRTRLWTSTYSYDENNLRVYKSFELAPEQALGGSWSCRWEFRYVYGGGDWLGRRLLREDISATTDTGGRTEEVFSGYRDYVWVGTELAGLAERVRSDRRDRFPCTAPLTSDTRGVTKPIHSIGSIGGGQLYWLHAVTLPAVRYLGEEFNKVGALLRQSPDMVGYHEFPQHAGILTAPGTFAVALDGQTPLSVVLIKDSLGQGYVILTDLPLEEFRRLLPFSRSNWENMMRLFLRDQLFLGGRTEFKDSLLVAPSGWEQLKTGPNQIVAFVPHVFLAPGWGGYAYDWTPQPPRRNVPVPPAPVRDGFFFVHNDLRGVPIALSNTAGQVVWQRTVDEFGRTNDFRVPFVLPGQYADFESGYYYNVNRYYDPEIGRYLQPDPLGGINPYVYADDNPIRFADPVGLFSIKLSGTAKVRACWTTSECMARPTSPSDVPVPGFPPGFVRQCPTRERCGNILTLGGDIDSFEEVHEGITGRVYKSLKIENFPARVDAPLGRVNATVDLGVGSASVALSLQSPLGQADGLINGVVGADIYHGLPKFLPFPGNLGYDERYHFDNGNLGGGYQITGNNVKTSLERGAAYEICDGEFWKDGGCPWCSCPLQDVIVGTEQKCNTSKYAPERVSYPCKKPIRKFVGLLGSPTLWKTIGYYQTTCTAVVPKLQTFACTTVNRIEKMCPNSCQTRVPCKDKCQYACRFKPYEAGKILHAIQDFWAHTNAIELMATPDGKPTGRTVKFGGADADLTSGAFDGNSPCKAFLADHVNCGDVVVPGGVTLCKLPRSRGGFAHCELAKDSTVGKHYMKAQRVTAAQYATRFSYAKEKARGDTHEPLELACRIGTLGDLCMNLPLPPGITEKHVGTPKFPSCQKMLK